MASAIQVEVLMAGLTDTNGDPLSGGKIYTYAAGTTTNKTTWTDADKGVAAANPVVLDAYGRVLIFADGDYKFVVKTSADVTLYTWDGLSFDLSGAISAALVLPEIAAPSAIANKGQISVFDDGGDTELRYTDASGNHVQLTKDGAINAMTKIASSVDNQVPRWDGTSGGLLQSSKLTISDAGIATLDGIYRTTAQTLPATSGTHLHIYGKTVSGKIELHTLDSAGNETQITDAGSVNATDTIVSLGSWTSKSVNTVYQAATDGFICVRVDGTFTIWDIRTDGNNPPTTVRQNTVVNGTRSACMCPVKKNDYYKVTQTTGPITIFWIPLS